MDGGIADAADALDTDARDPEALLQLVETHSTLPPDYASTAEGKGTVFPDGTWKANSHCSEIRLHPNGRWLYVGNRGHDSIAVFAVDQISGALSLVKTEPSGGACPRNFTVDDSGQFLVVGNQDSNNVTAFRIDPRDGSFAERTDTLAVPSPNYVFALPRADGAGPADAVVAVKEKGAQLAQNMTLKEKAAAREAKFQNLQTAAIFAFLVFFAYAYFFVGVRYDL